MVSSKSHSASIKRYKTLRGGIAAPQGFLCSGISSGIKKQGLLDLCLIHSRAPASSAAVFTRNRAVAAPIVWTRKALRNPVLHAVIANSGNANACTGDQGYRATAAMAAATAKELSLDKQEVAVASTGVIGLPLPLGRILTAIPSLAKGLSRSGGTRAARAIMTTDTKPKTASLEWKVMGKKVRIGGIAKGSGMIHPDMATMLTFLSTDAAMDPPLLKAALQKAVDESFHRITVDGDTSTNDMVLIMANGLSNATIHKKNLLSSGFQEALNRVCMDLARSIVLDGEGATKFATIRVMNGKTQERSLAVARKIACSSLVKTAFFGEDPNWGRIMAAAGASGVAVRPDRIDIYFDTVKVVRQGVGLGSAQEKLAGRVLQKKKFVVTVDLHQGSSSAEVYTSDLSFDYVKINAEYRS